MAAGGDSRILQTCMRESKQKCKSVFDEGITSEDDIKLKKVKFIILTL